MPETPRLELLRRGVQEVVKASDLETLASDLDAGAKRSGYIGFEPSGRVHLGWKITADKITDFVEAGLDFTVLLADWHAAINDKLGGEMPLIKACGEYMKECFTALGVPTDKVRFVYASDYVEDADYWATVIEVAKHTTLARMRRAMDIMGRTAEDAERDMSKFMYPAMQVADIFHMDLDLAFGGMDQRHAHMLCRDIAKKMKRKAPVAVHTPLLPSLQAEGRMDPTAAKMSKSKPAAGILIHDEPALVEKKIARAVCPAGTLVGNPVMDMARLIVFEGHLKRGRNDDFVVERDAKHGGDATFATFAELSSTYEAGKLHPADLKKAVARHVNDALAPVAEHFSRHPDVLRRMEQMFADR